ncbi:cysteine methyltransferase [Moraxella caviae]|uniref:Methylated-DNA--protein-cysteine methyltransferase n=1 Tax=Moraxella caviae TaxID=34060 RepID=A0A1T0A748_9GAMM|nr:cysteine methyltransferase [Moraxella caviae]
MQIGVDLSSLPPISLTVKDGKLLALDWHNDKTEKLLAKINENAEFIARETLEQEAQKAVIEQKSCAPSNQAIALQVCHELDEYFCGERTTFDVPLDLLHGTPFQMCVWQELCCIEYGQTISYKMLAERIGKPSAFRACANANGRNLISLIVPCHRVIAADGGLGGYTGGVEIKRALLALEKRFAKV